MLGTHVEQKGSLCTPDYLRFDFSHFQKVTPEELRQVERIVNRRIREDIPLQDHRNVPMEEAKKLGAIALFGEKYGDKVRVVQFGSSVEFCGGCHAKSTGRIGLFRIVSESSVAAGVRRIEAITGEAAEESVYAQQDVMSNLKSFFNNAKDLTAVIKKTIEENDGLKKQVESYVKEQLVALRDKLVASATDVDGVRLIKYVIPTAIEPNAVKDLAFQVSVDEVGNVVDLRALGSGGLSSGSVGRGSIVGSGSVGSRSGGVLFCSILGAGRTGDQTEDHHDCKKESDELFHFCSSICDFSQIFMPFGTV